MDIHNNLENSNELIDEWTGKLIVTLLAPAVQRQMVQAHSRTKIINLLSFSI